MSELLSDSCFPYSFMVSIISPVKFSVLLYSVPHEQAKPIGSNPIPFQAMPQGQESFPFVILHDLVFICADGCRTALNCNLLSPLVYISMHHISRRQ